MQVPVLGLVIMPRPPSLPLVMLERDLVLPLERETLFPPVLLLDAATRGIKANKSKILYERTSSVASAGSSGMQ